MPTPATALRGLSPRRSDAAQRGWSLLPEPKQDAPTVAIPAGPMPVGVDPTELPTAQGTLLSALANASSWQAMSQVRKEQLLKEEFQREQRERALKQENQELKDWVRRAAQVIDKSALKQQQLQEKLDRLEAGSTHSRTLQSQAVVERDQLRREVSELRQNAKIQDEQLCAFVLQMRRMKRQCEEFKSALQLAGVSSATVNAFDDILNGRVPLTVEPSFPGSGTYKIEEGRDALAALHGSVSELLEYVRAFVTSHVLSQEQVPTVHFVEEQQVVREPVPPPQTTPAATPGPSNVPSTWETAAQVPTGGERQPVYTEQLVIKEQLMRTIADLNRPKVTPERTAADSKATSRAPSPFVQERNDLLSNLAARLTEKENNQLRDKLSKLEARQTTAVMSQLAAEREALPPSPRHPQPMPPLSLPPQGGASPRAAAAAGPTHAHDGFDGYDQFRNVPAPTSLSLAGWEQPPLPHTSSASTRVGSPGGHPQSRNVSPQRGGAQGHVGALPANGWAGGAPYDPHAHAGASYVEIPTPGTSPQRSVPAAPPPRPAARYPSVSFKFPSHVAQPAGVPAYTPGGAPPGYQQQQPFAGDMHPQGPSIYQTVLQSVQQPPHPSMVSSPHPLPRAGSHLFGPMPSFA